MKYLATYKVNSVIYETYLNQSQFDDLKNENAILSFRLLNQGEIMSIEQCFPSVK